MSQQRSSWPYRRPGYIWNDVPTTTSEVWSYWTEGNPFQTPAGTAPEQGNCCCKRVFRCTDLISRSDVKRSRDTHLILLLSSVNYYCAKRWQVTGGPRTARWCCSVFFLEGLRLALRPWGQQNGAPIIAGWPCTNGGSNTSGAASRQVAPRARLEDSIRCCNVQTHIKRELEKSREGKTNKQEQRYDGTKQETDDIGRRKRGANIGRERLPIRKWKNDKNDTQEITCMDGSTCRHESDAGYSSLQSSEAVACHSERSPTVQVSGSFHGNFRSTTRATCGIALFDWPVFLTEAWQHSSSHRVHKYLVSDWLYRATRGKFWSGGHGVAQRIVLDDRHSGPCRTPTWIVYVLAIHCRDIIGSE